MMDVLDRYAAQPHVNPIQSHAAAASACLDMNQETCVAGTC